MQKEPEIYNAIRFGSILENVVYDPANRVPDYDDVSITENTRCAYVRSHIPPTPFRQPPSYQVPDHHSCPYVFAFFCSQPIEYIENHKLGSRSISQPSNLVFLTCDAYGVLPPVSRLTPEQASYHFIAGYTSKTPGTEDGIVEPSPTFSTCYGQPFIVLHVSRPPPFPSRSEETRKATLTPFILC